MSYGYTDGALQSDAPATPADIKLILGGKFLETTETLEGEQSKTVLAFPLVGVAFPDTLI